MPSAPAWQGRAASALGATASGEDRARRRFAESADEVDALLADLDDVDKMWVNGAGGGWRPPQPPQSAPESKQRGGGGNSSEPPDLYSTTLMQVRELQGAGPYCRPPP